MMGNTFSQEEKDLPTQRKEPYMASGVASGMASSICDIHSQWPLRPWVYSSAIIYPQSADIITASPPTFTTLPLEIHMLIFEHQQTTTSHQSASL
jgi:hypothetical protein